MLDRLRDDDAMVPSLWHVEVANVLLVAERRGRISEAQAARFVGTSAVAGRAAGVTVLTDG